MAQTPTTRATPEDLEDHLSFEVDWLVFTARNQRHQRSKNAVVFQNNAMLNARNLLEFTQPSNRSGEGPKNGWWICDFGGTEPPHGLPQFEAWQEFINAKVTHLGERRLDDGIEWPQTGPVVLRHVELAHFCLDRIDEFAPDETHPYGKVMHRLVTLGKRYLDGDDSALDELDRIVARRSVITGSTSTSDMAIQVSNGRLSEA